MSDRDFLGGFELQVLLALTRLRDRGYGMAVAEMLKERTGREPSLGAVYATLDRLEGKGFVTSRLADASEVRGARPRKYFAVTGEGAQAVENSWRALQRLRIRRAPVFGRRMARSLLT